jgi:hypothetical protein
MLDFRTASDSQLRRVARDDFERPFRHRGKSFLAIIAAHHESVRSRRLT